MNSSALAQLDRDEVASIQRVPSSICRITFYRGRWQLAALGACLLLLPFLVLASRASAQTSLCTAPGSGAGQCSEPRGVATDSETGHVYIADRGNRRVDVFEANGTFLFAFGKNVNSGAGNPDVCTTSCRAGTIDSGGTVDSGGTGSGAGELSSPTGVAVDNLVGSPTRHDVYVTTSDFRWQRFHADGTFVSATGWGVDTGAAALETCIAASGCQAGIKGGGECQLNAGAGGTVDPVAVGPGGNVFLADSSSEGQNFTDRVEKFSAAGACLGQTVLFKGLAITESLAIDSGEDAWVVLGEQGDGLRKYDLGVPETQICTAGPGGNVNALAISATDRLFASERETRDKGGFFQVIGEYGPSCNVVHRFGYGQIGSNLLGLAFQPSAEGDLFASEEGGLVRYLKIPDPGPIVAPESLEILTPGAVRETIGAEVNPEGKETEVRIEYVDQHSFEEDGFAGPNTILGPPTLLAPGFSIKGVQALAGCSAISEGGCLRQHTTYHYRVLATNADGAGSAEGEPFQPAPHLQSLFAVEVGTDAATLQAVANPFGDPTTAYFEYVDDASFQASGFAEAVRVPAVGSKEAELSFGNGKSSQTRGVTAYPLAKATTYHYRVVVADELEAQASEAQTLKTFAVEGAGSCPANEAFRTGPAALLPDCRAYEMVSPVDKANGDILVQGEALTGLPTVVNQSASSGQKLAYGSYRAFGDAKSAPLTSQYIAARGPGGWASEDISPPRGAAIADGAVFDNEFRAFSADLCEGWITPYVEPVLAEGAIPGFFNLYRDRLCAGEESYEAISPAKPKKRTGNEYRLEPQGSTEDGSVSVFAANDSLKGTAAPSLSGGDSTQLYAHQSGGPLVFVCILPGGTPSPQPCSAGTNQGTSLRFGRNRFASVDNAVSGDGSRIFWTNSIGDGPIYVRENPFGTGTECGEAAAPCTIAVSKGGEDASGTDESHYWAAAADGSKVLFTTGLFQEGKADLYEFDVATKTTKLIGGEVSGLVGAGEDATRVYFASNEVLTAQEANSEGDKAVAGKPNLYFYESAGGGSYRFVGTLAGPEASQQGSTAIAPYPIEHGARVSGDGEHAAFLSTARLTHYDNTDAVNGIADAEVFIYDATTGELHCASCNPSGARPVGQNVGVHGSQFWAAARLPAYENSLYASRALAENGSRLYFDAADSLAARDTNGRLDVYQWEQLGAGGVNGCREGDPSFSADSGGCVTLISSGQSDKNSEFVDASPDGADVFFSTLSSLLPQDPGLIDIYDARVDGGFPPQAPPAVSCEGEACQPPLAPPNDPTPASSSFNGAGNVVEAPARKKHAKKKNKKHAKKKHPRHRRAAR
jgi:NHL repeat